MLGGRLWVAARQVLNLQPSGRNRGTLQRKGADLAVADVEADRALAGAEGSHHRLRHKGVSQHIPPVRPDAPARRKMKYALDTSGAARCFSRR